MIGALLGLGAAALSTREARGQTAALPEVERFNYVLGTQTVGAAYQLRHACSHPGHDRLAQRAAEGGFWLVHDLTVRFCDLYVEKRSRTHDQMVQAARSGVQNIAEGSQASGTSKKMELKLTNVARASLEELRLDYEDYLRQRGQPLLPPSHPALARFKARRVASLDEVGAWLKDEHRRARTNTDRQPQNPAAAPFVQVSASPCQSVPPPVCVSAGPRPLRQPPQQTMTPRNPSA